MLTLKMLAERKEYVTFTILNFPAGYLSFNFTPDYIVLNILSLSFCHLYIIKFDSSTLTFLTFVLFILNKLILYL